MKYEHLTHDCELPNTDHLPRFGERNQIIATHRCPECGQRWSYEARFLSNDRFYWMRYGRPRRRWRKAEAARLAALEADA